jgi:MYXO-CTERM domain-containing protein
MRGRELTRVWNASGRAAPLEVGRATATVRTGGDDEDGGCAVRPQGVRPRSAWAGLTLVGVAAVLRRRRSARRAEV